MKCFNVEEPGSFTTAYCCLANSRGQGVATNGIVVSDFSWTVLSVDNKYVNLPRIKGQTFAITVP